jgi:DSBA-like thioredoxin domain
MCEGRVCALAHASPSNASRRTPLSDRTIRPRRSAACFKLRLRANTDEALALGVWGVPSFVVRGQLFWGTDSLPMMPDFLRHPQLFDMPEMQRLDELPSAGVVMTSTQAPRQT